MIPKYKNCKWRVNMKKDEKYGKQEKQEGKQEVKKVNKLIDKEFLASKITENVEVENVNKKEVNKKEANVKEVNVKEVKKKFKTRKCKIILIRKNKAFVDFEGQNIMILNDENKKLGDIVEVKYVGTMGKKDFKIVE